MSNEIITLVKDTSLARIIALQEIIWAGQAFMKGSHGISGAIWPLFFTARLLSDLERAPDRSAWDGWKRNWITFDREEQVMAILEVDTYQQGI